MVFLVTGMGQPVRLGSSLNDGATERESVANTWNSHSAPRLPSSM